MAREMKDSGIQWIGEIPRHWDVRPIKNSFSIVSGSTPDSDKAEYWEGAIPWITPADFKTIDKYTSGGSRFITEKGYDSCSTNMIPKGSIIFSKRAPIGSVVINKIDLCTNQGCLSCIKNDKTDSAYFYYLMSIYDDVFNLFGSGTTFKEISATTFGDFILPLPPLVEQQFVSSFLDSKCAEIDKAIEATKASIEEYKKLRQAIITETVTKGLDPDVEMKDSGIEWIGVIPTNWQIRKMNDVAKVITDFVASGSFGDIAKNVKYLDDPDYAMLIRTADVSNKSGTVKPVYVDKHSYNFLSNSNLFGGEILLPNVGAIGDVYIVPTLYKYMTLAPNSVIVRTKFCDKFFYYYFSSDLGKSQINNITSKTAMPKFNKTDFRQIKVLLPSLEEQHRIASFLDTKCSEIDSLIKSKEKLIEELTAYRKSLIYEYVTGKKEVPIESA